MADVWDTIKALFRAQHYIYEQIDKSRVQVQEPYDETPLELEKGYFRLWLCEAHLSSKVKWFKQQFPAVSSTVELSKFANKSDVKFSSVTDVGADALSAGVRLDYDLTPLLPLNIDVVHVTAGLLAMYGQDYLGTTIDVLKGITGLVAAPLGQALEIADKANNGINNLFGANKDNKVELAFHRGYQPSRHGGSNELGAGYVAIVKATTSNIDPARLSVKDNRLYYTTAGGQTDNLVGYDYMLLRIETHVERPTWKDIPNITEPYRKARRALLQGKSKEGERYKLQAITAADESEDLAVLDRPRVTKAIFDELKALAAAPAGALASADRSLDDVMFDRAMSRDEAAALRDKPLDDLLAQWE